MDPFLECSENIDWDHPVVLARASELSRGLDEPGVVAQRCYEWVRDEIRHSLDFSEHTVTCSASEVLRVGSGYCYAKSHLLAALLRANGLPAGFCYQRLRMDDPVGSFCLHGFNSVLLPGFGWYRLDARGNRADIHAQFTPPIERLAFQAERGGELDFKGTWPRPLAIIIEALQRQATRDALEIDLPDLEREPGSE